MMVAQPRIREASLIRLRVVVFFVFHTFCKEFYVQGEINSLRFISVKRICSDLVLNKTILYGLVRIGNPEFQAGPSSGINRVDVRGTAATSFTNGVSVDEALFLQTP